MCAPLPYIFSGHKIVFHPSKCYCYLQIDSGAFLVTVYVGIPTCLIFYCYLKIYHSVRCHNNNFHTLRVGCSPVNVEEIKVARTLFVIVVFFNFCWAPILVIDIVDTIIGSWIFPREAYVAYSFLATISSALNPLIYGILNKNFQKEYFFYVFRCIYCCSERFVELFVKEGGGNTVATALNNNSGKLIICLTVEAANKEVDLSNMLCE